VTATRNTNQRREIVAALEGIQGFVSAQELHATIQSRGHGIALATVYAQLKKLAASRDVDVVMTDRGEALYRRCDVDVHHHHLSCRRCGTTIDIDVPELEASTQAIAMAHGFSDVRHVVELNGVCPACHA
jgi:Fur family ferric uptake transcriptional regulator